MQFDQEILRRVAYLAIERWRGRTSSIARTSTFGSFKQSVALVWLAIIAVTLLAPSSWAASRTDSIRLVRVIETGRLGHPYPTGLAYSARADSFLVVRASDGTSTYTDIGIVSHAFDIVRTVRIGAAMSAPTNMAYDETANRLLLWDPESEELVVVAAGADGIPGSATPERMDGQLFGLLDPRGMTVDPRTGALFVLDAAGQRIVRVQPDATLGFQLPEISEIDLWDMGLGDLRGLAFDPATGHLHVLNPVRQRLYEVTPSGVVVTNRDVSQFGLHDPQAMVFAPNGDLTDDPATTSLYIADSGEPGDGADGDTMGGITELSLIPVSSPTLPAQDASVQAVPPLSVESAVSSPVLEESTLVQTIDAWLFSPPSPDTAGATYLSDAGTILLSDVSRRRGALNNSG